MNSFNASLFLSASADDVRNAVERGLPAGRVFPTTFTEKEDDLELRIAFDFDGIIVDDAAEVVFKRDGLDAARASEEEHAAEPLEKGPPGKFFFEIVRLQRVERERKGNDAGYELRLRQQSLPHGMLPRISVLSPHCVSGALRLMKRSSGRNRQEPNSSRVQAAPAFLRISSCIIEGVAGATPSAHVPFGIANQPSIELIEEAYAEYEGRQRN